MLRVGKKPASGTIAALSRTDQWRELGYADLTNTVRRICTLCGWTQASTSLGRTLGIVSAVEREGKSSIARAMAIAMAQDHVGQVLLLECDLLRPSLGGDFGDDAGAGLGDVLAGEAALDDALRPSRLPNLWLLPAGNAEGNPSRLLRSPAMTALIEDARQRFAFIVLDLPAALRSSDAAVLARLADGVVLVVRAGSTDQRAVQQAFDLLAGVRIHGVVLNRWRSAVPDIVRRIAQF